MQSGSSFQTHPGESPTHVGDASLNSWSVSSRIEAAWTLASSPNQELEAAMVLMSLKDTQRGDHVLQVEEIRLEGISATKAMSDPCPNHKPVLSNDNGMRENFHKSYQKWRCPFETSYERKREESQFEEGARPAQGHPNHEWEAMEPDMPTRNPFRFAEYGKHIPPYPYAIRDALDADPKHNDFTIEQHGAFVKAYKRHQNGFDINVREPWLANRTIRGLARHCYNPELNNDYKELQLQSSRLRPRKCSTIAVAGKQQRTERQLTTGPLVCHGKRKRAIQEEQIQKPARVRKTSTKPLTKTAKPVEPLKKPKNAHCVPESTPLISDQRPRELPSAASETLADRSVVSQPQTQSSSPRKRGTRQKKPWPPLSSWKDNGEDPPYPYAFLITAAIHDSQTQCLSLNQIYCWISSHFSFFQTQDENPDWFKRWTNSVRHTSSLNLAFDNLSRLDGQIRTQDDTGMGGLWIIKKGSPEGENLLSELHAVRSHDDS